MEFRWCARTFLAVALANAGCKRAEPAAGLPAPVAEVGHLNQAQLKLPVVKLWLGAQELQTEVARTPTQQATGMMFRTEMAENEAMLFVFAAPHRASFYMKNTLIPLTCAYIDSEGVILEIHDMKPKDETAIEAGTDQVQYVLETKQGWFARHNVSTGTVVRTERGSLAQSFFAKR